MILPLPEFVAMIVAVAVVAVIPVCKVHPLAAEILVVLAAVITEVEEHLVRTAAREVALVAVALVIMAPRIGQEMEKTRVVGLAAVIIAAVARAVARLSIPTVIMVLRTARRMQIAIPNVIMVLKIVRKTAVARVLATIVMAGLVVTLALREAEVVMVNVEISTPLGKDRAMVEAALAVQRATPMVMRVLHVVEKGTAMVPMAAKETAIVAAMGQRATAPVVAHTALVTALAHEVGKVIVVVAAMEVAVPVQLVVAMAMAVLRMVHPSALP